MKKFLFGNLNSNRNPLATVLFPKYHNVNTVIV